LSVIFVCNERSAAKKFLDVADIGSGFQQLSGKRIVQAMK
jgi:hypothetical protein